MFFIIFRGRLFGFLTMYRHVVFFCFLKGPFALSETQNKELPPDRDSFIPGWLHNLGIACMMSWVAFPKSRL